MSTIGGVGFQASAFANKPVLEADLDAGGFNIKNVNLLGAQTLTGNLNAPTLNATTVVATTLTGTLSTASQPNVTSVGTQAAALNMGTNNITNAGSVAATSATIGSVTVSGTSISTSTGAGHLNISKNLDMNAHNILNAGSITGTSLDGTLSTQTQQGITKIGTQTANLNMGANDITNVGTLTATSLGGTLSTASQPNVTSLGMQAANLDMGTFNIVNATQFRTVNSAFSATGDISTLSFVPDCNLTLTPNGTGVVKMNKDVNMSGNGITNCASINTQTIPSSSIVGISDSQTLTNKTIDGSQLVDGSVTAAKLASGAGSGSATDFMFRTKGATQVYSSAGVTVAVSFPTANSSNGITYTASGSDFFVTIAKTGKYVVQWAFTWNYTSLQNLISHYITVNNGTNRYGYVQHGSGSSNDHAGGSCAVMNLVAGDVLRFLYSHNIAANIVNNAANVFEWGYLGIVQVQ